MPEIGPLNQNSQISLFSYTVHITLVYDVQFI